MYLTSRATPTVHRFGSRETVFVDTLVMRNSREEEMYAASNNKLRMIAKALVSPDRYDALFSRVMTLIPPEELQDALLRRRDDGGGVDAEKIGQLVQDGFNKWKVFHDKYSAEQKKIHALNPGLAAWDDVYNFLCEYAGARPVEGYSVLQFLLKEGEVKGTRHDAKVVTFDGNTFFACGDYAGAQVYGPGNSTAQQIGLNVSEVAKALRRVAFPDDQSGAGHIRWPKGLNLPIGLELPLGVIVLLKQTLRMEQATWAEGPVELQCFALRSNGDFGALTEADCALLLRGIFEGTVRTKPEEGVDLIEKITTGETSLIERLKRVTKEEFNQGVRYAVTPLFAGIVTAPL